MKFHMRNNIKPSIVAKHHFESASRNPSLLVPLTLIHFESSVKTQFVAMSFGRNSNNKKTLIPNISGTGNNSFVHVNRYHYKGCRVTSR